MPNQKVSISVPEELLRYTEEYRKAHGLVSRSDVFARAIEALRELDLIEGYKAAAEEHRRSPDPLLDSGISEGLEPSDGNEWL